MATIGSAKATLVDKIDSLTASATAKDTIYLAKALKENTTHHSFTFQGAWAASTAYALDDVVTTSGKTYICILAYTSGSSFAVGSNWSLMAEKGTDGTTVGTGTAGQVLKTNAAGNGTEWGTDAGGSIVHVHQFEDSTRNISTSNENYKVHISFTFTKQSSTSNIVFNGFTPIAGQDSYHTGVFIQIGNSGEMYDQAHFMSPPSGQGDDGVYGGLFYNGVVSAGDVGTGTITVNLGWRLRDSTSQKPGNWWNPQDLSGRSRGATTNLTITEVEPAKTAFIT